MYETELVNLLTSLPVITWSQPTRQIDACLFVSILYLYIKCYKLLQKQAQRDFEKACAKCTELFIETSIGVSDLIQCQHLIRSFYWWHQGKINGQLIEVYLMSLVQINIMLVKMILRIITTHVWYNFAFKVSHPIQGAQNKFYSHFSSCM